jgi:hypothetical protein
MVRGTSRSLSLSKGRALPRRLPEKRAPVEALKQPAGGKRRKMKETENKKKVYLSWEYLLLWWYLDLP